MSSHRVYTWRKSEFVAVDSGSRPDVAYMIAGDAISNGPEMVRVGRWDGVAVVDISDAVPWDQRPRRLG